MSHRRAKKVRKFLRARGMDPTKVRDYVQVENGAVKRPGTIVLKPTSGRALLQHIKRKGEGFGYV